MSQSAETASLAAVLDEDYAEAERLLAEFLPGELVGFAAQLKHLTMMVGLAAAQYDADTLYRVTMITEPHLLAMMRKAP